MARKSHSKRLAALVLLLVLLLATCARGQEVEERPQEEQASPSDGEASPSPPSSPSPAPEPPPPSPPPRQQQQQASNDYDASVSAFGAASGGVCGNANAALLEVLSRAPEATSSSSSSSSSSSGSSSSSSSDSNAAAALVAATSSSSSPSPPPCAALVAVERMGLATRGCHVVVISNQGASPIFGWSLSLAPDAPRTPIAAEGATLLAPAGGSAAAAAAASAAAPRLISYPSAPALKPGGRAAFVLKLDESGSGGVEEGSSTTTTTTNGTTLGTTVLLNGGRCFFQPPPPVPSTPLHLTGDYEFGAEGSDPAAQPSGDLYCCSAAPPPLTTTVPPSEPPSASSSSFSPPPTATLLGSSNTRAPEVAPLFIAVSVAVPVGLLLGVAAAAVAVLVFRRTSARRREGLPCWRAPGADGDGGGGARDGAPAPAPPPPTLPPASGGGEQREQQQQQPPLLPLADGGGGIGGGARRHASAPPPLMAVLSSPAPLARASFPSSAASGRSSLLRFQSAPAAAPGLMQAAAEAAAAAASSSAPPPLPPPPPPLPESTISQPQPYHHQNHHLYPPLPTATISRAGSSSASALQHGPGGGKAASSKDGSGALLLPPAQAAPEPHGLAALARSRGWLGAVRLVAAPAPLPPPPASEDKDGDEGDGDEEEEDDSNTVVLHERLGSGAHGTVFRCSWRGRRGTAAAKVIPLPDGSALRAARREVATLARAAPHPRVIHFLGAGLCVAEDSGAQSVVVLQTWARGGSLARALAPGGVFAAGGSGSGGGASSSCSASRLRVAADVALGLAALHSQGIVHRDVKPGNILLSVGSSSSSNGVRVRASLADFGVAALVHSAAGQHTATATRAGLMGTPAYLAPEVFGDAAAPTPAADVYALALVLWQLLLSGGEQPWLGLSHLQIVYAVAVAGERPARPPWVDEDDTRWRLCERCWRADPSLRPSAAEVARELEGMIVTVEEGEGL